MKKYRPISLISRLTDFEILLFILAYHLRSACIKHCFIKQNIKMNNVIDYVEQYQMPCLLLFLYSKTLFDSLGLDYIFDTLKHFNKDNNFKELFILTQLLTKNIDHLSSPIMVSNGIKGS